VNWHTRRCPLLAQSSHAQCADACPLLGAKRTLTNRCSPILIYEQAHGLPSPAPKAIVSSFVGHSPRAFDFIQVNWPSGGGSSHQRTRLRAPVPCYTGKYREIRPFSVLSSQGASAFGGKFNRLATDFPSRLSRENLRAIRELEAGNSEPLSQ